MSSSKSHLWILDSDGFVLLGPGLRHLFLHRINNILSVISIWFYLYSISAIICVFVAVVPRTDGFSAQVVTLFPGLYNISFFHLYVQTAGTVPTSQYFFRLIHLMHFDIPCKIWYADSDNVIKYCGSECWKHLLKTLVSLKAKIILLLGLSGSFYSVIFH